MADRSSLHTPLEEEGERGSNPGASGGRGAIVVRIEDYPRNSLNLYFRNYISSTKIIPLVANNKSISNNIKGIQRSCPFVNYRVIENFPETNGIANSLNFTAIESTIKCQVTPREPFDNLAMITTHA